MTAVCGRTVDDDTQGNQGISPPNDPHVRPHAVATGEYKHRLCGWLGDFAVRRPWMIIGFWIIVAAALSLTLPSPKEMADSKPLAPLPSAAPSMLAMQAMSKAFDESGSQNTLLLVLTDDHGLTPSDQETFRRLVDTLRSDKRNVVAVQDFVTTPDLQNLMSSADNKAWIVPVSLTGDPGTPQADDAYKQVVSAAKAALANTTLTVTFTGAAETASEMASVGDVDSHVIEIITAALVLTILLIVYRNPVTVLLPMATVIVSTVVAQQIVAGLAELGLAVSSQTIVLMTAMIVGAGTDYSVFLISRYHEGLRCGLSSDDAVRRALASAGKVLAASSATVGITFLGMTFARLGVFSTIGPALAITVAIALLTAVTLLPALLSLVGRRGWVAPRRDRTARFWRRSAVNIVRRPVGHLMVSLVVLACLAACVTFMRLDYDDRTMLPAASESNRGYTTIDQHFPANSTTPQYLLVRSPHDLRTAQSLADLELMAQRVSQVRDVTGVRGLTRPTGQPLEQAKVSNQAGQVGAQLSAAASSVANGDGLLNSLAQGSRVLADTIVNIRATLDQAVGLAKVLLDATADLAPQSDNEKALGLIDNAASLAKSLRSIGDIMGVSLAGQQDFFDVVVPVVDALNASPVCAVNVSCATTRAQLQRLVMARDNGAFDALNELGHSLQAIQDDSILDGAVRNLQRFVNAAISALRSLGIQGTSALRQKLDTLSMGANGLAQGSQQLAAGVQALVDQTRQLDAGLGQAATILSLIKTYAAQPSMAGFFLPPQALESPDFKKVAAMMVSQDGHAVRYLVQSSLNPFSTAAMDQVDAIQLAARSAQPNTSLSDATISLAGIPVANRDMRDYYYSDMRYIGIMTIVVTLAILMLLVRAVVAPLYLVGSAILSYVSALGIGVIVFQSLLHQDLSWTVPSTTFIVLVAVGADYNLLLISRIRGESRRGIRSGVIRAVTSTGAVITSAGIIFAASMFSLLFSWIGALVQIGFVIGVGLVLDTFVVRTVTVPALAALIRNANWWPSGAVAASRRKRAWRQAISAALYSGDLVLPQDIRPAYSRWSRWPIR
ncbi:Acyltrehalose exporter MmpL10 [Mycobacterium simulans]|uniref:MMPL/RND family transporter n=1 Tax=Mycobacterium simulans TaxID=627089 RepID=UPI001749BC1E|nr:MMPL family transporter [Mycobacterium simulans]SON63837.1 Acyltrehalose exporter MmpL10 [Mycobacterium simulans]